jgi:hypothetical protein
MIPSMTFALLRHTVLVMGFSLVLAAQTASVTGIVTDPSNLPVPGARVSLINEGTGMTALAVTSADGYYRHPSLPPGKYQVSIQKDGFQTLRQTGLTLDVGQVARQDYTLKIGTVAESVEVKANAVLLDSETSSLGQLVGGKQITELPLLGRNAYSLAGLAPGVRTAVGMNDLPVDQISTVSVSINGARASQNEFLLDGAPNTAAAQNQPVIFQNVDSVQEFKVETNTFSAEYGRSAGGVFNVVTKSGTNDLTFSVYDFFRNDALNANDFFANRGNRAKAPFRFNQFGGVLGGPVIRNRTFFFGSAELVRFTQGVTWLGSVPNAQQLEGDFSNTRNAAGQVVTIYDPFSTAANPAGGYLRAPFAGNRIPKASMDPVAANMARFFPAPTSTGAPFTGANNYLRTGANHIRKDTWSIRADHNITERNHLFGRYSADVSPFDRAPAYGSDNPASPTFGPQTFSRYNGMLEDMAVLSPSTILVGRVSYTRMKNFRRPISDGFDITSLGLPAALRAQVPAPASFFPILISGLGTSSSITNLGSGLSLGAADYIAGAMDTGAAMGSLTKTFSKQTVKAGGEYRLVRFNGQQNSDATINFQFTPAFTQGPNPASSSAAAGSGLASFMLGTPASGILAPAPALALQNNYYALFVQDDWKATKKLTVNLGLRYEYEGPRTDRFNQLANFDYHLQPPLQAPGMNLRGALTFVGVNGNPRGQTEPDRNNIAPRLGIAYRLTNKTVIRAGAGLFYGTIWGVGSAATAFGASGFFASTTMTPSLDGVTPLNTLRNPYPSGLVLPTGSSRGAATLLGQAIQYTDRGGYAPYSVQWNFNIQRELPGQVLFDLGYAGSRGVGFPQDRSMNQLPDAALQSGDDLRTQVANPFYGSIASGPLAQRTVSKAQLARPFPQFDTMTSVNAAWATSSYQSLQLKVEKRYARGFSVLGAWTYSKLMDYGIGQFGGETVGGAAFQDWNNLAAEWGVSAIDQTHRLILNGVWDLPLFAHNHGLAGKMLGGWQIGAIGTFVTGGPIGVSSAANNTFSQGGGQRPDWNGVNPTVPNPTVDRWLNAGVFSTPAPYHFGSAPRTFSGARSQGARQVDFTLSKTIALKDRLRVQFRSEFFNLTNTPRFAPPNAVVGSPQFGTISSQLNQPRVVQFGLKLIY